MRLDECWYELDSPVCQLLNMAGYRSTSFCSPKDPIEAFVPAIWSHVWGNEQLDQEPTQWLSRRQVRHNRPICGWYNLHFMNAWNQEAIRLRSSLHFFMWGGTKLKNPSQASSRSLGSGWQTSDFSFPIDDADLQRLHIPHLTARSDSSGRRIHRNSEVGCASRWIEANFLDHTQWLSTSSRFHATIDSCKCDEVVPETNISNAPRPRVRGVQFQDIQQMSKIVLLPALFLYPRVPDRPRGAVNRTSLSEGQESLRFH